MPRKASHFCLLPSVTLLGAIYFFSPHDMCFAWSVLYYLSLWFLVYHNHPCCTHLLSKPYMSWNLIEYSMCLKLCLFCLPMLVDYSSHKLFAHKIPMHSKWVRLKCASHILHDALLNSMVICFSYEFSPNMMGIQEGYNKNFHISALNIMRSLIPYDCFEIWR